MYLQHVIKIKQNIDKKAGRDGSQLSRDWMNLTVESLMNLLRMFNFRHPLRRQGDVALFSVSCVYCQLGIRCPPLFALPVKLTTSLQHSLLGSVCGFLFEKLLKHLEV